MDAVSVSPALGEHWAPLMDMSALPLSALQAADHEVLAPSLRQVIRSLNDPNGVISAFGSFVADK
jgi:FXSXX-COOH protein